MRSCYNEMKMRFTLVSETQRTQMGTFDMSMGREMGRKKSTAPHRGTETFTCSFEDSNVLGHEKQIFSIHASVQVCMTFHKTYGDLLGKSRQREVCGQRHSDRRGQEDKASIRMLFLPPVFEIFLHLFPKNEAGKSMTFAFS